MRSAKELGTPVWRHVRTNLRTRFALAFATVAVVVAALVGLLSYHAASERIYQEIDASLRSAAAAVDTGRPPGWPHRRSPTADAGADRRAR